MQPFPADSSPAPVTAAAIVGVFNARVGPDYRTVLRGGAAEPFYRPSPDPAQPHQLHFREDFVSSSLHELAHWLVAGPARQLLPDWGYWYAPDGRDAGQQAAFEAVEVRPQALEWLLHKACRLPFRVSLDNLGDHAGDGAGFRDRVHAMASTLHQVGISPRAEALYAALAAAFGGPADWRTISFRREELE